MSAQKNMEMQKKILELKRVKMAQAEMEFNILQAEADIERLKGLIQKQEEKADELDLAIKAM